MATAGFVIATRQFNVPYQMVQFSHGKVGIATLVLVYSQVGSSAAAAAAAAAVCITTLYAIMGGRGANRYT
jgi:hypothetical protein